MQTWNEIEADWLVAEEPGPEVSGLPNRVELRASPVDVEQAFERVRQQFGGDWIEERRQEHRFMGILEILKTAALLSSLEGAKNSEGLVERMRLRVPAAQSEALALHLLKEREPGVEVECEPTLTSGRRPDFRVRADSGSPWTYLEVVGPQPSDDQVRLREVGQRLSMVAIEGTSPVVIELSLERVPTDSEVELLEERLRVASMSHDDHVESFDDGLGRMEVMTGETHEPRTRTGSTSKLV